jgi:hypothetical protein
VHIVIDILTTGLESEFIFVSRMWSIRRLVFRLKNWPWDVFAECRMSGVRCLASKSILPVDPEETRFIEARPSERRVPEKRMRKSKDLKRN